MFEILTTKQMRDFEENTMKKLNINETDLMKKAGLALTKDFLSRVNPDINAKILVLAGIGNNGGDSLVMQKELIKSGYDLKLCVIGNLEKASSSFKYYFDPSNDNLLIDNQEALEELEKEINDYKYVIDAIFGIGLKREVKGIQEKVIEILNKHERIVYSIDIPSGLSPDSGLVLNKAVKANYTGVLGNMVFGNLLNDALDHQGEINILDIEIIGDETVKAKYLELDEINIKPMERKHNSYKYTYGLGLFIGGHVSMMGAIQMAAMASIRSGLGIARVIHGDMTNSFTRFYPELIFQSVTKYENIKPFLNKANSIVFGPGMETNSPMFNRVLDHLLNKDNPILIDAGGLEYINLNQKPKNMNCILTPHSGELARMFSVTVKEVIEEPLKYISMLTELGYTVVYKGPASIIADKNETYIIQAKNPGLAKAGTGDCLSGIIASYMVNNTPIQAALKGVALHSLAAENAVRNKSIYSMTASDLIESISEVLKNL